MFHKLDFYFAGGNFFKNLFYTHAHYFHCLHLLNLYYDSYLTETSKEDGRKEQRTLFKLQCSGYCLGFPLPFSFLGTQEKYIRSTRKSISLNTIFTRIH